MTDSPLPRDSSLGYQVNHLARALAQALRVRIAPFGVVPGQFAQLLALYERDGLSQTELSGLLQVEQPTMANTLSRMQRDGLITRVPDPNDGRRSLVLLTERARGLRDQLAAAARDGNAAATRGLDDRQVAAFLHTLNVLIANLEKDDYPARRGAPVLNDRRPRRPRLRAALPFPLPMRTPP